MKMNSVLIPEIIHKSKEKKIVLKKYIKDNVFDTFDITELLNNDLEIPKAKLDKFIYKKEINNSTASTGNSSDISEHEKIQNEIISEINNNNHFKIEIEKLNLTFKNGYEIPFIELYQPIKLIGQGHFGLVLSVINNETHQKMAVKIIRKQNYNDDFYLLETNLLNKLENERVIKLYNVINTEQYLFIFTELCEGGSLKDYIISRYNSNKSYFMKDSECALIIKNIMQGVEYLSNNGIIHRDLKPENIMFRKENDINSLVLCDFGLAQQITGSSFVESRCGTLLFMAPEIINKRSYDSLVDIWSIGIIMYILESGGSHPIYEKKMSQMEYFKFVEKKNAINFPDFFPDIARNFFMKLCRYDAFSRYNIYKALKHPWITRTNNKIPLTIIEDAEKDAKIQNFKNMLVSFMMLRQLKILFKRRKRTHRTFSQTLNINKRFIKNDYYLGKTQTSLDKRKNYSNFFTTLKNDNKNFQYFPKLCNTAHKLNQKKIYTVKSSKNINSMIQEIKPNKLFPLDERYKLNKIIMSRKLSNFKKFDTNKIKNIELHIKPNNNYKEPNLYNKVFTPRNFKFEKNAKKIRLLSAKKIDDLNNIIAQININNKRVINNNTGEKTVKYLKYKSLIHM